MLLFSSTYVVNIVAMVVVVVVVVVGSLAGNNFENIQSFIYFINKSFITKKRINNFRLFKYSYYYNLYIYFLITIIII